MGAALAAVDVVALAAVDVVALAAVDVVALAPRLLASAACLAAAAIDLRSGRVPNWLTLPLMALGLARAAAGSAGLGPAEAGGGAVAAVLGLWLLLYLAWQLAFFGGGDARLLMGLVAFWPTATFGLVLAWSVVLLVGPQVVWRHRRSLRPDRLLRALGWLPAGVLSGSLRLHPTHEELARHGARQTWVIAAAALAYAWLVAPPDGLEPLAGLRR